MASKINEAHEHIAKAEKNLKTSMTKWKPDFDSAASEYAKAAVCFKNAKQFEQAKDAYLKEAEYHTENKALFHAAKAIEQAGMMMKDLKKMPEAIQYIEKASMMYVENGTPDTAAMALDRAGKLIEPMSLEKAVDLYQQAAGVFENEDRLRQSAELLGKASRLLVRLRRKQRHRCWFIFTEMTLWLQTSVSERATGMYLLMTEYVSLEQRTFLSELVHCLPGYSGSEDCVAMETLLQGYDEQDEDQVHRVCNSALLKYMDNDYAKLAISLKVPGGGVKKKKSATATQGGAGAPAASAEDDDDYEGGLC
ncbi:unnamed protein product [Coregonus sp. 'balchen']|nr:unnamed protein product [Coregonus sp. 'balchen']